MTKANWPTGFLVIVLAFLALAGSANADDGQPRAQHTFALGTNDYLLDGKPFQIIGGEMHPARIPREYWRHRIRMAKAMGINTIPIYVFWNQHEEQEGKFDFTTGERNIGEFIDIAREEGEWIILRGGPYVCGEWDFGGLPWWLLRTPDIKLRCSDPRFTGPVARYLHELAKVVRPRLVANGGPILMIQVENEYGSYPRRDHAYLVWLRDQWIKEGVNGPFITADGAGENYLHGLTIPGLSVGLDTGTNEADFALARRINPGVPIMSTEVYPGWLRHWGEGDWSPTDVSGLIKFYMDTRKSFSLYVFHGGTNFGFTAGANGANPSITSYDYGAPLNEQGRPTPAYFAYRKQLASYLPAGQSLPDVPESIPTMTIPPITLTRWSSMWEQLPVPVSSEKPECFELLGQNQGFVVYRTRLPAGDAGSLSMSVDGYPQVYLNGDLMKGLELPAREKESTLEILVEAMGHINFQGEMESDRKGIRGGVKLNGAILKNWEMLRLPLKSDWAMSIPKTASIPGRVGGVFKGHFILQSVADTYLDMSAYKKGVVWMNGHNLGRYWSIGPQRRLYCPAPWLNAGGNTIVVLDSDLTEPRPVQGCRSLMDAPDPLTGLTLKAEEPAFDIDVPANTVKTEEMAWPAGASVAVARIDPMTDAGNSWGIGLAVGWADGKYVQVNARVDGRWGVRFNGNENLSAAHPAGKPALTAIKLTDSAVQILVKEDAEDDWRLISTFPRDQFSGVPQTIRFGKIGAEWKPRNHPDPGSSDPCRVEWVKVY